MKLRIKGNSLRMRLTRPEIARLAEAQAIEESVSFGAGACLTYRLEPRADAAGIGAKFDGHMIRVAIPAADACRWARSREVSLHGQQPIGDASEALSILIEKDFFCLKPRTPGVEEDESELFPNPNQAHGSCG